MLTAAAAPGVAGEVAATLAADVVEREATGRSPVREVELLREAGLLLSHRGKMGGYRLARPTHLISLGEIIRVIEGPLALISCVSRTAYKSCGDCVSEADCAIRFAMMRVRDETARILDGTSLADANAEELVAA